MKQSSINFRYSVFVSRHWAYRVLHLVLAAMVAIGCAKNHSAQRIDDPVPAPSAHTHAASTVYGSAAKTSAGQDTMTMPTNTPINIPTSIPANLSLVRIATRCERIGLAAIDSDPKNNIVFSPVSVCYALGMLTAGASNSGLQQLSDLLGAEPAILHSTLKQFADHLRAFELNPLAVNNSELPKRPGLHRANQLVMADHFTPQEGFVKQVKNNYHATVSQADLGSADGKLLLDTWIRTHTGGRIETSAIAPSPQLVMVLQDAVFFAAAWKKPFSASEGKADFRNGNGKTVRVPVIKEARRVDYAKVDGWQAVRLDYGSTSASLSKDTSQQADFSAIFVLGASDSARLTNDVKNKILSSLKRDMVMMQIPIFKLKTKTDLEPLLYQLGVSGIFDATTRSLEGIAKASRRGNLAVSQAQQQAMIEVTESGTIAAATTELGLDLGLPVVEKNFIIDRPFFMLVMHNPSGMALFQVAVRNL